MRKPGLSILGCILFGCVWTLPVIASEPWADQRLKNQKGIEFWYDTAKIPEGFLVVLECLAEQNVIFISRLLPTVRDTGVLESGLVLQSCFYVHMSQSVIDLES